MSIDHLHDDLLFYLAKYLHPRDCLALALSGRNERFSILYGTDRKRLVLSECYFLSNKPWKRFFKDYITPSSITVCDVSHCYWLKAKVLLCCIIKMPNLEELHIQDTRVSLKKMPLIFESCQKIVKLSLTLKEDNLDDFEKGVMEKSSLKWMKRGFRKITHLKFFTFVVPSGDKNNYNAWIAVIGVLKWCRDCTDLRIETTFKEPTNSEADKHGIIRECKRLWKKVKPKFVWMEKLNNLVIIGDKRFRDYFTATFLDWVRDIQGGRLFNLERLWTTEEDYEPFYWGLGADSLVELMDGPIVKSLGVPEGHVDDLTFNEEDERFWMLEHLAEVEFYRFQNHTELKYIRGECNVEELDDFFKSHKKLEQLHLHIDFDYDDENHHHLNLGDWELPLLKDLVFWCNGEPSDQRVLNHLLKACSNIDQVHFKFFLPLSREEMTSFSNTIRFNHLTWLTIDVGDLFDGSNLVSIVKSCPKLERLFLKGNIEANTFFLHLSECVPLARNLSDLRVQWPSLQEDLSDLVAFFKALKRCPTLRRLVLYAVKDIWKRDAVYYAPLQDAILPFVKRMPYLVALCLAGFPINHSVIGDHLTSVIAPDRPAFWFYLGAELPKAGDMSISRDHFEGIVDPIDPYYASPF